MLLKRLALLVCIFLAITSTYAQQTPVTVTKDSQALSVLTQSMNAIGGLAAISTIQDYTGTGNITYYWAGEEVQASAAVRGMGIGGFRLDATLPTGVRTSACSGYAGVLITPDGKRSTPSFYNQMTTGSMTLPYIRIAAAMSDATTSIMYVGPSAIDGKQFLQIHFAPTFGANSPGHGKLVGLGAFDVFLDPSSLLVTKLSEIAHSDADYNQTLSHELDFSNYQKVGNIAAPLTVSETLSGQTTWSLTLTSLSFNGGLTSDIFAP